MALPVAIVSVAYNSQGPLKSLAVDLGRQGHAPLRWLIVDQAPCSAPVAPTELQPLLGAVELVLLPGEEGHGFAAGCNHALDWLQQRGYERWIWLLNPDTSLPRGDELARLASLLAEQDQKAVVGTAVRLSDGRLEPSGGWISPGLNFRQRHLNQSYCEIRTSLALDWLSGCSLLMKPSAHCPPARFDPRFPLYYEDLDLCLRLKRGGAQVLWMPEIVVLHQRGKGSRTSSSRRLQLSTISYLRFLRRYTAPRVVRLRSLRLLIHTVLRLPLQPRRGFAVLRGFRQAGPADIPPTSGSLTHV